ncbi:MAG: A/G-specific adenine glycosylase [Rudaea sp.]|nr:A/G-specific adenine glycosylase [Rudaea sp.]
MATPRSFSVRMLRWFDRHGRHDLPWQEPRTPYRVWVSEVMLQQTRVATAIPYFLRFVEKFPSLPMLAAAIEDDVLALWSGLGYYSRARNLHRAAQICVERHGNDLPQGYDELAALPGIGRSTAGAILAQAHGRRFAILDGNVKRVLARFHGIAGWPGSTATEKQLWKFAETNTPHERLADYTQAIMDLGATLCLRSRPQCASCPLSADCVAFRDKLTAQLPARKPARALPTRSTVMLVLRDRSGQLLLERRPPTGIWARLWSLPEATDARAARRRIARDHGLRNGEISLRPLPPFVHTFSHYRLNVTPLTLELATPARVAANPDRRWLQPADAAVLGLPAPVRKLIESFLKES